MKINHANGRYWLGDHGHLLGMQGVMADWWRQWTGVGGQHRPFGRKWKSAFDRYYKDGKDAWIEEQASLLLRTGVGLLTQWTDPRLAICLNERGVAWVPLLMGPEKVKSWVKDGADANEGVNRLRSECIQFRRMIENLGYDPVEVMSGVIDFQEPIWTALHTRTLYASEALALAEEMLPRCAEVLRREFPGVPVWSPKLAGSTRRDHIGYGWIGWDGDPMGGRSHRWPLLRAAAEGRDVLNLNCYGAREDHRLKDQHEASGLPIAISEFSHWVLNKHNNPLRAMDFDTFKRSIRFTHADSTDDSVEAITRDLIHDAESPFIVASCVYLWSYHAWDWGFGPRTPLFGYLGHAVDPTQRDRLTNREWRDYHWMDGLNGAISDANQLAKKLRGT